MVLLGKLEEVRENEEPQSDARSKVRDLPFVYMCIFLTIAFVHTLNSFYMFQNPYDPNRWLTYGWIERPEYPWWYQIPFMLMAVWVYNEMWITHTIYMFPLLLYMKSTNERAAELETQMELWRAGRGVAGVSLDLSTISGFYRQDQLLNRIINNWMSSLAMPAIYFTLLSITICCFYVSIRTFGVTPMPSYLEAPVVASAVFIIIWLGYTSAAVLHESSCSFRHNWLFLGEKAGDGPGRENLRNERKWIEMFGKSCRSLRMEMSYCFFIDQETFPNMLCIIVEKTIDLLLTFT